MIRPANDTIRSFIDKPIPLDGLDMLDRLLKLGWWIKATDEDKRKSEWSPAGEPVIFKGPVLILAGGCSGLDSSYRSQLDSLKEVLGGFRGTLVSGGTRSGIAEIAGDLQEKIGKDKLQTVGYLPAETSEVLKGQIDERYSDRRYTTGTDFSTLEPLAFWEDFLALGGDPKSVKLIGFNGGRIAACEFRIALAFGAQVGIVQGSGRAADELLADPLWKGHASLHPLDLSEDALESLLMGSKN